MVGYSQQRKAKISIEKAPSKRNQNSQENPFLQSIDAIDVPVASNSKMKVVIRVGPSQLNGGNGDTQESLPISIVDNRTIQVNLLMKLSAPDGKAMEMQFDGVYEEMSQNEFFASAGLESLLQMALDGYAVTVFAYGQTGSGKTYTITGPSDQSPKKETVGIVPRALDYLFKQLRARKEHATIQASYLEIYNEHVLDLLNPTNTSLPVRWSSKRGFFVENLYIVTCAVLDDALAVLEEASHDLNEHSSRSHSVLTVYVESQAESKRYGKICFVDLAGSEKVKESKATGETFNETLNINKSLLTLGKCISALSDPKRKGHIPYRDSKLTKLLSDSLTGSAQALMIACISPMMHNMYETIKTLRYAQQASNIPSKPVISFDPRLEAMLSLKQEIRDLKRENEQLKGILEKDPHYIELMKSMFPEASLDGLMRHSDVIPPQTKDDQLVPDRLEQTQRSNSLPNIQSTPAPDNVLGPEEAQERLLEKHRRRSETKRRSISRASTTSRKSASLKLPPIQKSIPVDKRPPWADRSTRKSVVPNKRFSETTAKTVQPSQSKQRISGLMLSQAPPRDMYLLEKSRTSTPYPFPRQPQDMQHGKIITYSDAKKTPYPEIRKGQQDALSDTLSRVISNKQNALRDVHQIEHEIRRMSIT